MMSFIGKKFRSLAIACLAVLASLALLFGLAACKPAETQKEVSLVNWKDETIEVEWNAEVAVSNSAAYDADGNAYAVIAQVTQADGAPVQVLGSVFRAEYAGGYVIEYSLADPSVSAPTRKVTVNIKGSDTPRPYFTETMFTAYENEAFDVPDYEIVLNGTPQSEDLKLFRVEGEDRTEVTFDADGQLTLPQGQYVFTLQVTSEGGKTGSAELSFRVRDIGEKNAIAALNDANGNVIGVSSWVNSLNGYRMETSSFTSDVFRNEYVSYGSVKTELPGDSAVGTVRVHPEISQEAFIEQLGKDNAVISVWLRVDTSDHAARSATWGSRSAALEDGVWTNIRMSAADLGYANDLAGLYTRLNNGSVLFNVQNLTNKAYTLYIDSIYIAVPLTATLNGASAAYGEELTLTASSEQTDDFYYELYDVASPDVQPQMSGDGSFTPRVAGTIRACAWPASNAWLPAAAEAAVTVTGQNAFAFAQAEYSLPYGESDIPSVGEGFEDVEYNLMTADGSACYSYVNGDKIRMFEGEHRLYAFAQKDDISYTAFTTVTGGAAPVDKGDLENFDSPESLLNVTNAHLFTYVGDFEGASGVVKFLPTSANVWANFTLTSPMHDVEQLLASGFDENDLIELRVYAENIPVHYSIYYTPDYGSSDDRSIGWFASETWQSFYIPLKDVKEKWDLMFTEGAFCFTNNTAPYDDTAVYFDYIRVIKANRTPVAETETTVEYQNFDSPAEVAPIAANGAQAGMSVEWLASYQDATGVLKMTTATQETWPSLTNLVPRLTQEEYMEKGVTEDDKLIVRVYNPKSAGYTFSWQLNGNHDIRMETGWNEIEIPASVIFSNFDSLASNLKLVFTTNAAMYHEVYIDSMYFVKAAEAGFEYTVSDDGMLTITPPQGDTSTYEVKVGNETVYAVEGVYNLAEKDPQKDDPAAHDVTFTITRKGADGETIETAEDVWSVLGYANELSVFSIRKGRDALLAAYEKDSGSQDAIRPTFEDSVSDGVVTKHNVAKFDLTNNTYSAYPRFSFGTPLCQKPADGLYTHVVFTIYAAGDLNNVIFEWYDGTNNKALSESFKFVSGWHDYYVPISVFDYGSYADGSHRIMLWKNDKIVDNITVYVEGVRYAVGYEMSDENVLTVANVPDVQFTVQADGAPVSASESGYDIGAILSGGEGARDVTVEILYTVNGRPGRTAFVISTPPAADEVNFFGSAEGRSRLTPNSGSAIKITFVEKADKPNEIKHDVAKLVLSGAWPGVRLGAPLHEAAADSGFKYVVFTVFIDGDRSNLRVIWKDETIKEETTLQDGFSAVWTDLYLPIEKFDSELVASGKQFLFFDYNWGNNTNGITVWLDGIRYATEKPAE